MDVRRDGAVESHLVGLGEDGWVAGGGSEGEEEAVALTEGEVELCLRGWREGVDVRWVGGVGDGGDGVGEGGGGLDVAVDGDRAADARPFEHAIRGG